MRPRDRLTRFILVLMLPLFLSGCTFSLDWIRQFRAQRAVARHDFATAIPLLQAITEIHAEDERGLAAARTGAKVAHLDTKNYPLAVRFYRHLVLRSEDPNERKFAQRSIAQIYYENMQDLDQAVVEYEKLLKLDNTPEEAFRYRLSLAKTQLGLNNVGQALTELNVLLENKPPAEGVFEIKMLKANVQVANKQLTDATQTWESIRKEFPERSAKENVAMNMVVVYEELKEFDKAIATLETMRDEYPNTKFIDQRIERLKERQYNLPGAQGLKR